MAFLDKTGVRHLWEHIIVKLGGKVDKIAGKGLSTNDFTNEYKDKLDNIGTNGLVLNDETTGAKYRLFINNGELTTQLLS